MIVRAVVWVTVPLVLPAVLSVIGVVAFEGVPREETAAVHRLQVLLDSRGTIAEHVRVGQLPECGATCPVTPLDDGDAPADPVNPL